MDKKLEENMKLAYKNMKECSKSKMIYSCDFVIFLINVNVFHIIFICLIFEASQLTNDYED